MVRIAIVDDDPEERARIRECLDYVTEQEKTEFQIDEFGTGRSFLGNYKPVYDIVFMDIAMPGLDGMATARSLRELDTKVLLIFVTNLVQYALEGYSVDALDFLLKPINRYSFALKMKRALSRTVRRTEDTISVKTEGAVRAVPIDTIRYLEVSGHYVIYHTTEGDYPEYSTMKEAERKINRDSFAKCSQSFLINLRYVTGADRDRVLVENIDLPFSRPQKKAFLEALSGFMGGRQS